MNFENIRYHIAVTLLVLGSSIPVMGMVVWAITEIIPLKGRALKNHLPRNLCTHRIIWITLLHSKATRLRIILITYIQQTNSLLKLPYPHTLEMDTNESWKYTIPHRRYPHGIRLLWLTGWSHRILHNQGYPHRQRTPKYCALSLIRNTCSPWTASLHTKNAGNYIANTSNNHPTTTAHLSQNKTNKNLKSQISTLQ